MRSLSWAVGLSTALLAAGCVTQQVETTSATPNPGVKFGKPITNADIAAWESTFAPPTVRACRQVAAQWLKVRQFMTRNAWRVTAPRQRAAPSTEPW